jgi:plastocyanin
MRTRFRLTIILTAALGLSFAAVGATAQGGVAATSALNAQEAAATITIKDFMYDPAGLNVKVGQSITITNNDGFNHTVTARDGSFDQDVPANGSVTLMVKKAGSFPYSCTYHPGQHNPATINAA